MDYVNLSFISLSYSPALGAIQKEQLDIAVVEAVFVGIPGVTHSTKCL